MINTILGVAALIICAVLSYITLKTTHHIEGLEDVQARELEAITAMKNYTDHTINNLTNTLDKQTDVGLKMLEDISKSLARLENDTTVLKRRTEVIKSWYQNEQEGSGNNGVTWANDYPVGEDNEHTL
jgi:hypothetical protein